MRIHICPQSIPTNHSMLNQAIRMFPIFWRDSISCVISACRFFWHFFYTLLSYNQVRILTEAVPCLGAPSCLRGRRLPVLLYSLSLSGGLEFELSNLFIPRSFSGEGFPSQRSVGDAFILSLSGELELRMSFSHSFFFLGLVAQIVVVIFFMFKLSSTFSGFESSCIP